MSTRPAHLDETRRRFQIAVIVGAAGFLGAFYSILLPLFIAPDEPAHVDAATHAVAVGGLMTRGEALMSERTVAAQRELQTTAPLREGGPSRRFLIEDATPRSERPRFTDLGSDADSRQANYVANHPPPYYLLTGTLTRMSMSPLPETWWTFDRELLVMRWVNVLLLMGTTALTYPLGRSMGLGHRGALAAMALPLAVPQYLHIGGSVNSDNLFIFASTALVVSVVRLVRGAGAERLDQHAALLTGLSVALVTLSKAQGLAALVFAAGLVVWIIRSPLAGRLGAAARVVLPPALLTGPMLAINVVRTGQISPRGDPIPPGEGGVDVLAWFTTYLDLGSRTFWGAFGWLDASLTWTTTHLLTTVGVVILVLALFVLLRTGRWWLLAPWSFCLLATAVPVATSLSVHLDTGTMRAMQGRYFFPALPLAACTIVLAAKVVLARRPRSAVVGAGLVTLTALVLWVRSVEVVFDRHWGQPDAGVVDQWRALAAWSPTPTALTLLITGAGVAGGLLVATTPLWCALAGLRSDPQSPEPDEDRPTPSEEPVVTER